MLSFRAQRKVGQKYLVSNGVVSTFDVAQAHCKGLGGAIVLPKNGEENQAVFHMLKHFSESETAFLGARDKSRGGQYLDLNNNKLTFTNWYPGQPNNRDEDCVCMGPSNQWHDYTCVSRNLVICEM